MSSVDITTSIFLGIFLYWSFLIIGAFRGRGSWQTLYDATETIVACLIGWSGLWFYISFIKHDGWSITSLDGYDLFMFFSTLGMIIGYLSRVIYLKRASNKPHNVKPQSPRHLSSISSTATLSQEDMKLELKHKYLADENEREDGAKYYLNHFCEGKEKSLKIRVGPVNDFHHKNRLESYVKSKLSIANIKSIKEGFIFKKHYIDIVLDVLNIDYENMLEVTNVQYDIILALELKVEVSEIV